jgi:fructokinase
MDAGVFGGIEGGGSKWVCAIGTSPDDVRATETFPTSTPAETIGRAVEFFVREGPVDAVGIGSFGPVDLRPGSPTWGFVTTTPKPGWANASVGPEVGRLLSVPVAFDTDVDAAALAEHRWGAAQGVDTFCYVTVGTGIGGGAMVDGSLLHGLAHPEFGHLRVPHDTATDPFPGVCPYHGDCWEGLASGPAMEARWGRPPPELAGGEPWELEAHYLALGLAAVVCVLSPERIVLGGGVAGEPRLLPLVRRELSRLLAGYVPYPELVAPALGARAGVLGALALAATAAPDQGARRSAARKS